MGAKKKPEKALMNVQVAVQITKQQKQKYMDLAEQAEVTYSDWVRDALEEKAQKQTPG
jgi:regulator of RNase E activity RraB